MKIKIYNWNDVNTFGDDNKKSLKLLKKFNYQWTTFKRNHYIEIQLSHDLHSILVKELQRTPIFCHSFIFWALFLSSKDAQTTIICKHFQLKQHESLKPGGGTCHINLYTNYHYLKLNFSKELLCWCLLSPYINQRMQNEYIASYLSTLGGAYSALGDYYEEHAKKAGMISRQQFILASKMNDPVQRLRCQLFFAHSLMQQDQLKSAYKIIKYVFFKCKQMPVDTNLVVICCRAAWSKYKYLKSLMKDQT